VCVCVCVCVCVICVVCLCVFVPVRVSVCHLFTVQLESNTAATNALVAFTNQQQEQLARDAR